MAGREVVIVGAARTPIGSFLGSLASVPAPQLGAVAIREALARAGVEPSAVDEVIMGNVLQAGVGQAPGAAGGHLRRPVPTRRPAWTLNKVCGSGLKAVISGAQAIALGDAEVVVAGGMESMSNVPYYDRARARRRAHGQRRARRRHDPRRPVGRRTTSVHMGICAEAVRARARTSRARAQDEYAIESTRRAVEAQQVGRVQRRDRPGRDRGEEGREDAWSPRTTGPKHARPDKIPSLKPVFKKDGTVTAANASSINDGARGGGADERRARAGARAAGRSARLHGWGGAARKPGRVHHRAGRRDEEAARRRRGSRRSDIDLWEINEAFAVVSHREQPAPRARPRRT